MGGEVKDSLRAAKACCAFSSRMNLSTFFNSLKKGGTFSPSLVMKRSRAY
jgi:hypothetical protein